MKFRQIRRGIGTWLGVFALLCPVLLPFGVARLADAAGFAAAEPAEHYHDPALANALGPDWVAGHSHAGDTSTSRVRLDLGYLTPVAVLNPPEAPTAAIRWVEFIPDTLAPAPACADAFSRPLPRAPPQSA